MPLRRVQVLFTLVGVAEAAILPFLPLVLKDRGLSAAEIGVVLAVAALAGFVANPLWGHAADGRLGAEHALVVAASSRPRSRRCRSRWPTASSP